MNGQQENNNHNHAEEILRYLSGKMDRQELHAFEKNMFDDDLLAEAVEGYQLMREGMGDDAILARAGKVANYNIHEKKRESEVKAIPMNRFKWAGYAVAASLVLAAGWWIFSLTSPNHSAFPEKPEAGQLSNIQVDDSASQNQSADVASVEMKDPKPLAPEKKASNTPNKPGQKAESAMGDMASARKMPEPNKEGIAGAQAEMAAPVPSNTQSQNDPEVQQSRKVAQKANAAVANVINLVQIDTANAAPVISWPKYQSFLNNVVAKPRENSSAKAIIEILPNGQVEKVTISGGYTQNEKAAAEKAIQAGPVWKNKTGKKAQAILEWQ